MRSDVVEVAASSLKLKTSNIPFISLKVEMI